MMLMVNLVFKRTKNPKMFTVQGEDPVVIHLLQGKTVIGNEKGAKTVKQLYLKNRINPEPEDEPPTSA